MATAEQKRSDGKGKKPFKNFGRKLEEKGIPILKIGRANNFYKFRAALSNEATERYGNLGKLIDLEKYYIPSFTVEDYTTMGISAEQAERMNLEKFKEHSRKLTKMEDDRPKLYGLIMKNMSVESKDEVAQEPNYDTWHSEKDPEKLWQAIIETHKVDCVSSVSAIKELAARKAYQNIKQGPFESLAQYSERFRDTYRGFKATGTATRPIDVTEEEQALDFFHGLDPARYGSFKTNMLNGWATKAFDPPKTVNEIYRIAGSWVRPAPRPDGGTASSYVTIEEEARSKGKIAKKAKEEKRKHAQLTAAMATAGETAGSGKGANGETAKIPKDLSHIKCFKCDEYGHYSTSKDCPLQARKNSDQTAQANGTWGAWEQQYEGGMFMTSGERTLEDGSIYMTQGLSETEVLLDNQANISIVNPRLLKNVRKAKYKVRVKGVGGTQLIVDQVGDLEGFFEVYASAHTKANVLSFADVEDKYEITYDKKAAFTVQLSCGKKIEFTRKNKLYVADWCDAGLYAYATVQENEAIYTKEEVRRARVAYELVRTSAYPSPNEIMHLVQDGNVRGMPPLSRADVERAFKIYGLHPEYVRGQMTNRKVGRAQVDLGLRTTEKRLRLFTDVMHVDDMKFLITATDPLNLTLQTKVTTENRLDLGMALQGQMSLLRTRGFEPTIVYTDPHSTFRSMTQDFPGVEIDVGGAGDYVAKVDAKIRRIKETYRKVKAGLPWELPEQLVEDLVAYVTSRVNIRRTTALAENICPRVLFTGIPVDYKKELTYAFGDYVEAYEGTTNTSRARSSACIALYPTGNSIGTWVLWKIETRSRVRKSNMIKLVTTDSVIAIMNATAYEERTEVRTRNENADNDWEVSQTETERSGDHSETSQEESSAHNEVTQQESVETHPEDQEEHQEGIQVEESSISRDDDRAVTTRSGRQVVRPVRFAAVTRVSRSAWKETLVTQAIKKELKQLFEELVALVPVKKEIIPENATILNSHMFVVNKFNANGDFEKVKARLVADGRDQDPAMYPNKSSPTVAIHSVFTVLGMAAEKRWRIVAKVDIKGAFVQTPMIGPPIFMRLDPKVVQYAKELYPEFDEYLWQSTSLYTVMLKAMYGCVQASALWYALIRSEIEIMGYQVSETDQCVFVKQVGDRIFTLLLHVDDILGIVDKEEAKRLESKLKKRFGDVQFETGENLSYLGMQVSITNAGTTIDMSYYVGEILKEEEELKKLEVLGSPTTKGTYTVDAQSERLPEKERKWYHSTTAKLLYLAKQARPDILTAVIFLCTRVQEATCEDREKLRRVLGYLKGTRDRKLLLRAQKEKKIVAYVDAAYAVHDDSKSHSGVMIYVGDTLVYVSSKKQKCMSKSPTEAELIALTDNLGLIELFREFLEFVTQSVVQMPTIYQDCSAVVSLVTKGGGKTRTKHLRARMNLAKEMVDEARAEIIHVKAPDMRADGFTKPYEEANHKRFAKIVQGEEE